MKFMKTFMLSVLLVSTFALYGCFESDAKVASANLAEAAEQFELNRRIVFYNGRSDTYMLTIEGKCSIEHQRAQLEVTCKTGKDKFKKHHLGLAESITYFSEQLAGANISVYHYKVIFKPQSIIPDVDLSTSLTDKKR